MVCCAERERLPALPGPALLAGLRFGRDSVYRRLAGLEQAVPGREGWQQLSLFDGNVG